MKFRTLRMLGFGLIAGFPITIITLQAFKVTKEVTG